MSSRYLYEGASAFFQYYDVKYEPQNTMITLDYPVLKDLSGYTGIDRIYEYILCLKEEQAFLAGFPEDYVEGILSQYDKRYETMIENICGPVKSFFAAGSKDCIDL